MVPLEITEYQVFKRISYSNYFFGNFGVFLTKIKNL